MIAGKLSSFSLWFFLSLVETTLRSFSLSRASLLPRHSLPFHYDHSVSNLREWYSGFVRFRTKCALYVFAKRAQLSQRYRPICFSACHMRCGRSAFNQKRREWKRERKHKHLSSCVYALFYFISRLSEQRINGRVGSLLYATIFSVKLFTVFNVVVWNHAKRRGTEFTHTYP